MAYTTMMDNLKKENLLNVSLRALQVVLQRELGLKNIQYTFNEEFKQELDRRSKKSLEDSESAVKYPYGYMVIQELAPDKDRQPFKTVRKHGLRMGTEDATFSTAKKAYMFPAHIGIELHYFESNPYDALITAQAMLLLTGASGFSFDISVGSGEFKYNNKIGFVDNVTIPMAEVNNAQNPMAIELTLQIVLDTYVGFFKDVAAVNSGNATVMSFTIDATNSEGSRYQVTDKIILGGKDGI